MEKANNSCLVYISLSKVSKNSSPFLLVLFPYAMNESTSPKEQSRTKERRDEKHVYEHTLQETETWSGFFAAAIVLVCGQPGPA